MKANKFNWKTFFVFVCLTVVVEVLFSLSNNFIDNEWTDVFIILWFALGFLSGRYSAKKEK